MTTTVREICSDALIELGVLDPSEAMDASAGQFALRALNRMLKSWNLEDLMVYTVNRDEYSLVAGTQLYTLGTGGTFNAARPVKIDRASVLISGGKTEIPIGMLTDEEWQGIAIKSVAAQFPVQMWANGNYPLNGLYFWPVPSDSTVKVVLYSWGRTADFSSLNDSVAFPDGYEEAMITNLAVALASSYGVNPNQTLVQRALASKGAVQSINIDPLYSTAADSMGGGRSLAIRSGGLIVDRI